MKTLLLSFLVLFITACASAPPVVVRAKPAPLSEQPLDFYTKNLADNLFAQIPAEETITQTLPRIAVASFVPLNKLSLVDADDAEKQLANQLSESMLAHARVRGFKVYDYRLRQQLQLADDHEQILSRQLADIGPNSEADTMLVGTYTNMEDGVMLNARLIQLQNKQVLAAASGYVPANVFWSRQQVSKRGDKLYRHPTTGELK